MIYLLISYCLFGNSFQWELAFYRNQSINFLCIWFESCLSDVAFHWVKFTNSLKGYICPLYSFWWASLWVIKRVSIYLFPMPLSLAQWCREKGAFYNNTLVFYKISIFYLLLSLSYGSIFCASNYRFYFECDNALPF